MGIIDPIRALTVQGARTTQNSATTDLEVQEFRSSGVQEFRMSVVSGQ
jgi:hypothetical protein